MYDRIGVYEQIGARSQKGKESSGKERDILANLLFSAYEPCI